LGVISNMHGNDEKLVQNFGREPDRKGPFGRPRRRWENNIKIVLKGICLEDEDSIHVSQECDWRRVTVLPL